MSVNWREVVPANKEKILRAAAAAGDPETVCVLFDIDLAREGKVAKGVLDLILVTQLHGAVPIDDPDQHCRFVCLPVSRPRLLSTLEQSEMVEELRGGLKTGGTVLVWVVCYDGPHRTCLDIHAVTPEAN
jgi:hypothetical protein